MSDTPEGASSGRLRRWARRQRTTPEDRRRVLQRLAIRPGDGWWFRFATMFGLSVVIAATGLSQGSTAVVIGAMLVAPLLTPIMALAAGLAMGSFRLAGRGFGVVGASSVGGVLIAWLLAGAWQDAPLTTEVLARTSPDVRDLLIGVAAGAAGAYATIREDISGSLPGAGVAVALVPPLAAVGMTLREGRADLARGALLLYATNVTAIVLASATVFVATGFVPLRLLAIRRQRVGFGAVLSASVAIAVAVPLVFATNRAAQSARTLSEVNRAVVSWLTGSDLDLVAANVQGQRVTVDLAGAAEPPAVEPLQRALTGVLGTSVEVRTRWVQRTTLNGSDPQQPPLNADEVRAVVRAWLAGAAAGTDDYLVTSVTIDPGTVSLEISSPDPPPPANDLAEQIRTDLGSEVTVDVLWTREPRIELEDGWLAAARSVVSRWAGSRDGLVVSDVAIDWERSVVTIDLVGTNAPTDVAQLVGALRAEQPSLRPVVRFVERRDLTATTTTRATTSTTSTTR